MTLRVTVRSTEIVKNAHIRSTVPFLPCAFDFHQFYAFLINGMPTSGDGQSVKIFSEF